MRKLIASTLSALIIFTGFQTIAPAKSVNIPEAAAVNTSFYHTVKCPVMKINNEGTGHYIYGHGKDRKAALKNANDKLGQQFGKGYKLKHCRDLGKFAGGGGSDSF